VKSVEIRRALGPIVAAETAGLLLGLGWGLSGIREQRYPSLGFWHSAAQDLGRHAASGVAAGAAAGVAIVFLRGSWALFRRRTGPANASGDGAVALKLCLGCLAAGLAMLFWMSLRLGAIDARLTGSVAAAAALACAAVVLTRRLTRGGKTITVAAYVALAAAFFVAFVPATRSSRDPLNLDGLVGKGVVTGLLVGAAIPVLRRVRGAGETADSKGAGGGGRATALLIALAAVLPLAPRLVPRSLGRPGVEVARPRNVILIGIDTLRYDHTSLLGPDARGRSLTPRLARLAARGTVFQSAISQSCWTMPAFASILTGRYPQQHQATALFGRLRNGEVTLAEVLREAGYATGAVVSHLYVDADHGFSQGFSVFNQDHALGPRAVSSAGVTDGALTFLRDHRRGPFFLFLHYFDPHYEYRHHDGWSFSTAYSGWLRDEGVDFDNLEQKRHLLDADDLDYLRNLYDEEIAYTDGEIGRLLDGLEHDGLLDDTAIVVVGDHGEEFMERGWMGHGTTLYDDLIHVPMLMVLPGALTVRKTVPETVETRAIFPTLLGYLGVRYRGTEPPAGLLPLLTAPSESGPRVDSARAAFSSVWVTDAPLSSGKRVRLLSVRTDDWKLILDETRKRSFLYDVRTDPGETRDVAANRPEVAAPLLDWLKRWWEETGGRDVGAAPSESSPDLRDRLKSLGYL
jgi:arylsulfatase A-like enzyme